MPNLCNMAPHLSPSEQDVARQLNFQKKTTTDILKAINRSAAHRGQPLSVNAVRRFLRGKTHRQGGEERRGRKRVLGLRAVKALNKTRKALVKRANGEHEVHWQDVIKKTRVKQVHRSTAKRAFAREGVASGAGHARSLREAQSTSRKGLMCAACGKTSRYPSSRRWT